MTEQIVSTAYVLNSTKPRLGTQVLSGNFIDGVNARYMDLEPPSSGEVSDTTMKKYVVFGYAAFMSYCSVFVL